MREVIEKLGRALQCACERNAELITALDALATEATLAGIGVVITNMSGTLDDMFSLEQKANWSSIVGNSVEYTYYSGFAAGNPSGSTNNLETIAYKTGASTAFTQTFEYDGSNRVIKITTT